jgi:hypothetical protein
MPKLCTGIERIDRHPTCRVFKRTTYGVLQIVQGEWLKARLSAGTVRAADLHNLLDEPCERAVRRKYSFPWVTVALIILEIILKIWINRNSLETCSTH